MLELWEIATIIIPFSCAAFLFWFAGALIAEGKTS